MAYLVDRTGVALVFGSLFYAIEPGLPAIVLAGLSPILLVGIPLAIDAAKWIYDAVTS